MANLGCLLVCTFGNFPAPVLVAAHTVNNLHIGDEQDLENEGYESDFKKIQDFLCTQKNCFSCANLYTVTITARPGLKDINEMDFIEIIRRLIIYVPDHVKTQEMCNDPVCIKPLSWRMSLTVLKHKKCASRQWSATHTR